MKHLEKMEIKISVSKSKDYRGYKIDITNAGGLWMWLRRALALCDIRVGDLVWYSKVWPHEKRISSSRVTREVTDSLLCHESRRNPKDSCGRGEVCGRWDWIVFLRIIGESNSCLAQISFLAIDLGFQPQFEFSMSRKKAWMIWKNCSNLSIFKLMGLPWWSSGECPL